MSVIRDQTGRIVGTKIFGIDVFVGTCLKVVYGRYCWYVRIEGFTENPTRILAKDIYDNSVVINLAKATLVMTIPEEEYYAKKFAIQERLKKKEEEKEERGKRRKSN